MQEVRHTDCKNCSATRESIHSLDHSCFSDDLHTKNSSRRDYQIAADIISFCSSFGGIMKFMMLFGLLTLQGSQPAVAGTDFGSGLQSIPYIGDLGDISTGFASVRNSPCNFYNRHFYRFTKSLNTFFIFSMYRS